MIALITYSNLPKYWSVIFHKYVFELFLFLLKWSLDTFEYGFIMTIIMCYILLTTRHF